MSELLSIARDLRSTIDANAQKAGDEPVPRETVDALRDAGIYGLMTPRELGGAELPVLDTIDVVAEVSRADGSAGWCLMAGATTIAYFGAYGSDDFVQQMFGDGIPLAAGQFAPNGSGVREGDGYRISGNYSFGSGIHCADWVGAGFIVPGPEGSDAPAEYLFGVVPKTQAELRGNWDVLGLQSTASFDYVIEDAWLPEGATFLFAAPTRRRGGRQFELGVMVLTAAGHMGFALGVARRALDETTAIAKTKIRMGSGTFLKDSERFLELLATLESRYAASRAWAREAFATAEATVLAGRAVDPVEANRVRQCTVYATQQAAEIVRGAYLHVGTSGLRDGPLQRCFRDIHAGTQHFFASPASSLDMARDVMAVAADSGVESDC